MKIRVRFDLQEFVIVQLVGDSAEKRVQSLLEEEIFEDKIKNIAHSHRISYYDIDRTNYFRESDWPQRVADVHLRAIEEYARGADSFKTFLRNRMDEAFGEDRINFYRHNLHKNWNDYLSFDQDLSFFVDSLETAFGEQGADVERRLVKPLLIDAIALAMDNEDDTSIKKMVKKVDDSFVVEVAFYHGIGKYDDESIELDHKGKNELTSQTVLPNAVFFRLLDLVNAPIDDFIKFNCKYLGSCFRKRMSWKEATKKIQINEHVTRSLKLHDPSKDKLCSVSSVTRLLDTSPEGGAPVYMGVFPLKAILDLKPGYEVVLNRGIVGLLPHGFQKVINFIRLENNVKFVADNNLGFFSVLRSAKGYRHPYFLRGQKGLKGLHSRIKPADSAPGMGRGMGKGFKKPKFFLLSFFK